MSNICRAGHLVLASIVLLFLVQCGSDQPAYNGPALPYTPEAPRPKQPNPTVLLSTSQGDIELELFEDDAPNTVGNFVELVDRGFYNGLKFHRIMKNFMIQGGDPQGNGQGGPGYKFPDEIYSREKSAHPNKIEKYVLAMANTNANASPEQRRKGTNGSQFFIMTGFSSPRPDLDTMHTVFGRVTKGQDVVDKLASVEVVPAPGARPGDPPSAPKEPQIIKEAKVLTKRSHPYVVQRKTADNSGGMPPGMQTRMTPPMRPPQKVNIPRAPNMPPPPLPNTPDDKKAQTKPAETKPSDKPAETKPAETKPVDTKPVDTKPAEKKE
ncbi:MAG TPA: peptidylprolyl isomerase [Planctomycetota bacterium]|jgi:cyclophilin family peptidyl-prolyl cis-trans isomerase